MGRRTVLDGDKDKEKIRSFERVISFLSIWYIFHHMVFGLGIRFGEDITTGVYIYGYS